MLFVTGAGCKDIEQVWFAGVHSDVGGSYPEAESQLSKLAFQWILGEAEQAGLAVDPQRKADMLGGKPPYVAPDPTGPLHKSLHGLWWIAEIWPKVVRIHEPGPGNVWKNSIHVNLGEREHVEAGGLMTYGVSEIDLNRRAATYADKILKGAKPADLPVQQATKFEFIVNLKAAKQIGLTIPVRVLERANQVIK